MVCSLINYLSHWVNTKTFLSFPEHFKNISLITPQHKPMIKHKSTTILKNRKLLKSWSSWNNRINKFSLVKIPWKSKKQSGITLTKTNETKKSQTLGRVNDKDATTSCNKKTTSKIKTKRCKLSTSHLYYKLLKSKNYNTKTYIISLPGWCHKFWKFLCSMLSH